MVADAIRLFGFLSFCGFYFSPATFLATVITSQPVAVAPMQNAIMTAISVCVCPPVVATSHNGYNITLRT